MGSYQGSCHCGRVAYAVEVSLDKVISCNCSWCQRRGSILAFAPESAFRLSKGEDALTDYRFNSGRIQHLFCETCGVEPFAKAKAPDGTPTVAINVRCLEGVDPGALSPTLYDGRSR